MSAKKWGSAQGSDFAEAQLCLDRATLCVLGNFVLKLRSRGFPVQARLAVQKCVFLDGAAGQIALRGSSAVAIAADGAILANGCGGGDVRDLLGIGVLATDLCDADVTSFSGFGEGVVATVKVLALLWIVVRQKLENGMSALVIDAP